MNIKGKFIYEGDEKFYIKGVTYGTFLPDSNGNQFPVESVVDNDFAMMALNGINSVRTYTLPTRRILDLAQKHNLKVMVGLPWEQHITFLDSRKRVNEIIERVKADIIRCSNHPAILCFTIGNEIPAPIVRWYGKKKIEKFLKKLYVAVKKINPDALVTYVNYPTTEYLDLPFLDFFCFNVYLETPEKLNNYLARLHNLAKDKPLVLAEIGLDSIRNGLEKQAETIKWQVENIFANGCAGIFVFAWTDEWWRGGAQIEDWDFGLVDRNRKPKPALYALSLALDNIPVPCEQEFPLISVVICSYNGSSTIKKCLDGIYQLDYPNYEVILVDDGSTDNLVEIAGNYPVKIISTSNEGLSNARNTGMLNAKGEIIAYIDDDAYPDKHWLSYLAYAYNNSTHASIGGPNILPDNSEFVATCVANAPGGPVHVMITDEFAEHIPGCNMTFRKNALMNIGGFDSRFRAAGDDVDVCWRIQESGGTIGFHPSALVWHLRRNSLKAYWKQQKGYGKAEALLEAKWPEKYNSFGHITWNGRIYGKGFTLPLKATKDKVFHGSWGNSLFQSVYQSNGGFLTSIPLMPEWYLFTVFIGAMGMLGFFWTPLFLMLPVFFFSIGVLITQAVISARKNSLLSHDQKKKKKYFLTIVLLHLIQPIARLYGRLANGLTPWRKRGAPVKPEFLFVPRSKVFTLWSEKWNSADDWLITLEKYILATKTRVKRGDVFDNWDLQIKNGLFASCRCVLAIEEYGMGKQFLKLKCWNVYSMYDFLIISFFMTLSVLAFIENQVLIASFTGLIGLSLIINFLVSSSRALNSFNSALKKIAASLNTESILESMSIENNNEYITAKGKIIAANPFVIGRANRKKVPEVGDKQADNK